MIKVKIEDFVKLLGRTKSEIEEMLQKQDIIELNLSEKKPKCGEEDDELRIFE